MKYALVKDGTVLSTISGQYGFDPVGCYPWTVPEDAAFIECSDSVENGDTYSDGVFTSSRVPSQRVERADFLIWAASNNILGTIEDIAADSTNPLRSSAIALKLVSQGSTDSIDFALQANQQMLAAWVKFKAITQAQAEELLGLAK